MRTSLFAPVLALVLAACAPSSTAPSSAAPTAASTTTTTTTTTSTSTSSLAAAALSERVDAAIDGALREQRVVGAVVLVLQDGKVVYHRAAGLADREVGIAMREDAIFRYSSVTKPIVSAAALALVDSGALKLDDPITKYLPDFKPRLEDGRAPTITVRHLLTHTSGLGYGLLEREDGPYHRAGVSDGLAEPGLSFQDNARTLVRVPLLSEPGAAFHYSLSTDVLGEVVARAGGGTLPEVVSRLVTKPLGMQDAAFAVRDRARLAAAYAPGSPRPVLMADGFVAAFPPSGVRFAPSRIFDPKSYPSGGAGMAGTAADVAKLLEAIRTGGGPILTADSVRAMTSNQIGALTAPELGEGWGFGYGAAVLVDPARAKSVRSAGSFRWGGIYGHSWWVDPTARLTVVAMTNTAIEGMAGKFPTDLEHAVYGR